MKIEIPAGISIQLLSNKIRFIGDRKSVSNFAKAIRQVSDLKNGSLVQLGKVDVKVTDEITAQFHDSNYIEMPAEAWNIFASKIQDVVEGFEENPFDFNDCGYLSPKLPFDIGIEITR